MCGLECIFDPEKNELNSTFNKYKQKMCNKTLVLSAKSPMETVHSQ